MTGLLDPALRVPPVPVDTADACPLPSALSEQRSMADDLDDVRRSAQQLLSGMDKQPSALRIRAGEVVVEMEWAEEGAGTAGAVQIAEAAVAALTRTGLAAPALSPAFLDTAALHAAAAGHAASVGHALPGHAGVNGTGAGHLTAPGQAGASAHPGGFGHAAGAAEPGPGGGTPAGPGDGSVDVCATTVGTFYRAAEPGTAPFVVEGDHVKRGQQVAIIEVMKLMIPVEAERDGRIVAVHVADGTSVEYGDRLLTIAPATGH